MFGIAEGNIHAARQDQQTAHTGDLPKAAVASDKLFIGDDLHGDGLLLEALEYQAGILPAQPE